jgi:hypothetical protein
MVVDKRDNLLFLLAIIIKFRHSQFIRDGVEKEKSGRKK